MKTKTNVFIMCVVCLCFALSSKAQPPRPAVKTNSNASSAFRKSSMVNGYAYRVFQAPDKTYGYDIFKNGKGIFHQPANANPKDAMALSQQQLAEKAAGVSIEKLKDNKPANLSPAEIKKIIANN